LNKFEVDTTIFPHVIVDDFLSIDDYNTLVQLGKDTSDKLDVARAKILLNDTHIVDTTKYLPILESYMKELKPENLKKEYYLDILMLVTTSDYNQVVHCDSESKLLSCAVYLYPENNYGTFLGPEGECDYQIPWKTNRAFIFCRGDDTWHTYKAKENELPRCSVNLTLKEVR
jgi:hypothetical protein|tara:strand:- start:385 stop:900 length:516 start_codon:yes stop_codon:yes gene_type:complete